MTVAPGTLPGRNQPAPLGSAVYRTRAHSKACPELWPAFPNLCVPEHKAQGLILGELGHVLGEAAPGGAVGCAGSCAATLHTLSLQSPSPCHLHTLTRASMMCPYLGRCPVRCTSLDV